MGTKAKPEPIAQSKSAGRNLAGKNPQSCGWFVPIAMELRQKFPRNTAAEISSRAHRHISVVEKWLAGKGAPDGEALLNLQNSDVGRLVIFAATRRCGHPWRAELEQGAKYVDAKQQLKAAQRALAAAEEI